MSATDELSFDKILQFMLQNGGKVTNHELVKHFKVFLTDPSNRAEARETFKKNVNNLASIKNQNNEKWLILKRKYMVTSQEEPLNESCGTVVQNNNSELESPLSPQPGAPSLEQTPRQVPPYKPPPQFSPLILSPDQSVDDDSPPFPFPSNTVEPLASQPLQNTEMKENEEPKTPLPDEKKNIFHSDDIIKENTDSILKRSESPCDIKRSVSAQDNLQNAVDNVVQLRRDSTPTLSENDHNVLVKERKKIFNRNNGEGDLKTRTLVTRKSAQRVDNQKRSSVMPHLDPKGHEWIVRASAGDYDTLSRMSAGNPSLVRLKDPSTGYTALHWACKRGDERLVKMLATLARHTVNERTNGGYTPLHIAMQFRHENIYKLLIEVFDADPTLADWSGRKPRQYPVNVDSWSPSKKAAKKQAEKDLGFLRIGSLNLRVKKTTEAFSNFLGVGAPRAPSPRRHLGSPQDAPLRRAATDHEHLKAWGSADNIPKDNKMPPPTQSRVKRRMASRGRGGDVHSRSTPSTPNQPRARLAGGAPDRAERDSDSDSAAGFHAAWQAKRSSAA